MRKLLLFASLLAVAFASTANAATLTVTTDSPGYTIGDTITLTVTGDTQGAFSILAFGRLLFDNPSVANVAAGTPNQSAMLAFGSIPWFVASDPLTCTASSCEMMDQISPIAATMANSTIPLVATVSFAITGVGISNVTWDTSPFFALDFFGLTNAPGTTITVIPEPMTGALLALGLLGLGLTRGSPTRRM